MEHISNANENIETKGSTGKSGKEDGYPLHKAVVENDSKKLEELLQKGEYDINERDLHGFHKILYSNLQEILRFT